ncbi:hypothetical protein DFH11DRAFT_1635424, partial [Phellopilus nigrolimitatus]
MRSRQCGRISGGRAERDVFSPEIVFVGWRGCDVELEGRLAFFLAFFPVLPIPVFARVRSTVARAICVHALQNGLVKIKVVHVHIHVHIHIQSIVVPILLIERKRIKLAGAFVLRLRVRDGAVVHALDALRELAGVELIHRDQRGALRLLRLLLLQVLFAQARGERLV